MKNQVRLPDHPSRPAEGLESLSPAPPFSVENYKLLVAELVDALRGMEKASEEIAVEFIEHKRATNWKVVNDAYCAAARAIAKAEGRP